MNARQGDHEERAEVAPAGRHSYSGSIKRVSEANYELNCSQREKKLTFLPDKMAKILFFHLLRQFLPISIIYIVVVLQTDSIQLGFLAL